jgi:3-hydroxyisobutyrate dehydrogenase
LLKAEMIESIAFLGLGSMGAPMTANLVRAGYRVKAWNRNPQRPSIDIARDAGAIIVSSIAEAVAEADIICTCVGDIPDVEEVLLGSEGAVNFARPQTLIVDFSTIGSNAAKSIADRLQQHQLRFLDAPVSGGDIGARNGTLTIVLGGETADFEECKPVFEALGKKIQLCGGVGSGQAIKLCNQVLVSIHMVALCEALELAQEQGIDPHLAIEVCNSGAAGSWALANLAPKIVESDLAPGFAIRHILKDLRLVQEILTASEKNLPGIELAERLFRAVKDLDSGKGEELGTQGMIRAYRS